MKNLKQWTALLVAIAGLASKTCWADSIIQHDHSYEQALRYEASADKTITPAKVLRYLMKRRGQSISAVPSPTEFQPIVNINNGRIRAVATIAYKF